MSNQGERVNTHFHPKSFSRGFQTVKNWISYQFSTFEREQLAKIDTRSIEEMSK